MRNPDSNPWYARNEIDEQRGGFSKCVMEESPSWGWKIGGWGRHEFPLPSSIW